MTVPSAPSAPGAANAPVPGDAGRAAGYHPRRALVLAGGGLKVAYQAGVLQVLLDEAGLEFDLADGASGGVFNLAMWCQGMTGRQMADNWRQYRPLRAFTPNLGALLRGPWGTSLLTFDGMRDRVLPAFGLDWHAIRGTRREATFELFDVARQELLPVPPAEMTEDRLLSGVALPMWFPPVRVDGDIYIDAVYATDANLEEVISRGATELWVIWTVSTRGQWRPGFVGEYFVTIEAAANSRLRDALQRIERSNADIAAGRAGEFGHPVTVRLIAGEVPLHYLLNFRRQGMARAVDLGVRDARAWCAAHGVATEPPPPPPAPPGPAEGLRFREVMRGPVAVGPLPGSQSSRMALDLDIVIGDVRGFVSDPGHVAQVYGTIRCAAFGGQLAISSGTLSLLADAPGPGPTEKLMQYDLRAADAGGRALTVHGVKTVRRDARLDVWADTTTLATEVRDDATGSVVAAGTLRLSLPGFLRQLTTFRAAAPTAGQRLAALATFGGFFADQLWQVYGRPVRPAALPTWLRKVAR
jgi:predicted acylesterase/phospholipase RssA